MATEITVPRLGWSMEEGTFAGWSKKDGEPVKSGDPLFALEGEKALEEVESLDNGILRIPPDAPKSGDRVKVGQLLGYLVAEGEQLPSRGAPPPSSAAAEKTAPAPVPAAPPPPPPVQSQAPVSPRARRVAAELGIDLNGLRGTGRGGRIRERDVRGAAPSSPTAERPSPPSSAEAIPVTTLRRTIAERMVQSRSQTAPVTLTCRADATNLVALRNQFKSTAEGALVPSYSDIVVKLAGIALLRHPILAARWEGERIALPAAINIGIAVDTESGLLVPVIRNVPTLSLPEIARQSRALAESARTRRIKPEQLQGGVFTLTNLGGFGIEAFTPIINFPETAILGLGAIRPEPAVLDDGRLVSREQLTLSLTFDHRVVDGAPAARFLQTLRQGLENPAAWLLADGR